MRVAAREIRRHERADVLSEHVQLEVDACADDRIAEVGAAKSFRDERGAEAVAIRLNHCQGNPIDRNRSFVDDKLRILLRHAPAIHRKLPLGFHRQQRTNAVDVPLHKMPAKPVAEGHCPLDVDLRAARQRTKRRARESFVRNIRDENAVLR
ncbi:MAG: hypothetical protein QOI58_2374 [Thermoanaerobaculia bacterium]|nr:hypothetical protein [Thermoanaerobaculia bacterium]